MSNLLYKQKWQLAVNDLTEQIALEYQPIEENELNLGSRFRRSAQEWFEFWAALYIKYIDIYKKLEDCYDQVVHPQKRELLKEMLENIIVRMCETKAQVVKYNNLCEGTVRSDYPNLDELIMDLKLTPTYLDIPIPRFFREEDKKHIDERNQLLDQLLIEFTETSEPQEELFDNDIQKNADIDSAISIIQRFERGRQGIERANMAKMQKKEEEKRLERQKKLAEGTEVSEETEKDDAALVIKKYWRGFMKRKEVEEMREKEFVFLGMKKVPENQLLPTSQHQQQMNQRAKMKTLQAENEAIYQQELVMLKREIKIKEGHDIQEKLQQERREWIMRDIDQKEFKEVPAGPEEFYMTSVAQVEAVQPCHSSDRKQDDKTKKKLKNQEVINFI